MIDVEFPSDLLDEYCNIEFGHDNWTKDTDAYGNVIITFWKDKLDEYDDKEYEQTYNLDQGDPL